MKILIAVATCHAYRYLGYHADAPGGQRVQLIRETWKRLVPAGVDFKFFYGRGEGTPKEDEIFLDVSDAFYAMPGKIRAIFQYALANGYDYVLECTDDVFVNVPVLLRSKHELAQYDYVGNALNLGNSKVPFRFVSGFAVWYSRKAMEIVASAVCADYDTAFNIEEYRQSDNVGKVKWHDDLWVGSVLAANGIVAQNDERFLIEIWQDIGNGPPSTFPHDKAIALHVSPVLQHMHNLMPKPFVKRSNMTMVVTSCDRHDLLKQTLNSFAQFADVPMDETIIVEDSASPRPSWLTDTFNASKLGTIVWLQNCKRIGQIYSIDRAYAEVQTDYIFHCEDDWLFKRGGFLTKSRDILDMYPKVSLVALSNLQRGPYENHFRCGMGLTFNPGLRRLADYKMIGDYESHCTSPFPAAEILRRKAENKQTPCDFVSPETDVANLYAGMGYVVGHLGYPCVVHTGDFNSTFHSSQLVSISVVMTTFNRPQQLRKTLESINAQEFRLSQIIEAIVVDDGTDNESQAICRDFGATYIKLDRPQSQAYRNPAFPNNVGIRAAKGGIVILQNAECCHVDPNTIEKLANAVTDKNVVFAKVIALNPDGSIQQPYCSKDLPRPYFFCGAIRKSWLDKLRGFDEDYVNAGYDDDDMAARLRKEGLTFEFSDIEVHHQWHPPAGTGHTDFGPSLALYTQKCAAMEIGALGTARNIGRDWGVGPKPVLPPPPPPPPGVWKDLTKHPNGCPCGICIRKRREEQMRAQQRVVVRNQPAVPPPAPRLPVPALEPRQAMPVIPGHGVHCVCINCRVARSRRIRR